MVARSELAQKLNIPLMKLPKGKGTTMYDYSMLRTYMDSGFGQAFKKRPMGMGSMFGSMGQGVGMGMGMGMGMGVGMGMGTGQYNVSLSGPSYRSPFNPTSLGFTVPYQLGQVGGGGFPDCQTYMRRKESGMVSGADALASLITVSIEELKGMGKYIDDEDKKKIIQKIDNYKTLENELIKTAIYLEEYKYLMELFGNYKSEILTMDSISQLVEKQKDLLYKQGDEETSLVKILGSLQNLLAGKCEEFVECKEDYQPASVEFSCLPGPVTTKVEPC